MDTPLHEGNPPQSLPVRRRKKKKMGELIIENKISALGARNLLEGT